MKKRLMVLGSVLLALVALYIVGLVVFSPRPQELRIAFPDVDSPDSISITQPDSSSVTVQRTDQGWRVSGNGPVHPARADRVEGFLTAIRDSRVGRLVGSGENVLLELALTSSQAYNLEVEESGRRIEALFGDAGTTPETIYYRTPASTDAYLLESAARFYLTQRPSYWSDLRVFFESVPAESIVRVDVESLVSAESQNYTVFLNGDQWLFEEREDLVDQNRVASLVRTAASVEAARFVPYQGGVEWTAVLRLHLGDGRVFSLYADSTESEPRIMAEGPGLPADEDGFPYHYRIGEATLNRIFPAVGDISSSQP